MTTYTPDEMQTLATNGDPLIERTTLSSGTVLAGRYRIDSLIGEGGMGDVYLAKHLKIDKDVAIKVLAPEQMRRPRTVGRFLQEAKASSRIRHENIVDITDYGESDGCAFFVMEYLEGEDLRFLVKREKRLPWSRIKPICIQLLGALSAAHEAGIIHRDIKPHNCFITPRPGNQDFVKVIDFGIAKLYGDGSEEQLTQTGAIIGTAEYMSPEQGLGEDIDGRTDLYSVGVILYRMLTGEVPYRGNNPMAILYQHIHADRVPPSKACPEAEIGPQIDALVLKALARDRDERFATAEDFIEAIEAVDATASAPSGGRLRGLALAGAATVLLGLGIGAWSMLQGEEAEPSAAAGASIAGLNDEAKATPEAPPAEPTPHEAEPAKAELAEPAPEGGEADADPAALDAADSSTADPPATDEPTEDAEPTQADAELPVRRTTREVRSRLARLDAKIRSCGKKAGLFPGESIEVAVKISPNGRVQSAKAQGSVSRKGASCIENLVRSTRFSEARKAQSIKHRYRM
ncbi:MAG: protein kinase [Myxococcota bacterium]